MPNVSTVLERLAQACLWSLAPLWLWPQAGLAQVADSPTLRKLRDTGVIVIGHRVASSPFSHLDARRRPIGYTVEICDRIVVAARSALSMPDLEVRMVPVTSATRLPMLANGTIDMECGITTNTAERAKTVSFSVTTFVAESRLLAKKGAGVKTLEDLRGKAVSTTLSTTSMQYLTAANQEHALGLTVLAGTDDLEAFQLVRADRAIAFAMDDVMLRSLLARTPDRDDYRISDFALTVEPYAIGLPFGDPVFKKLVDGVIVGLFRSGEIDRIYQRWFMSPAPPDGLNVRLPMSEALKRAIRSPTDTPHPSAYR